MSRDLTELQALLVLNAIPNIGPITTNRLLEALGGDPRRIFTSDSRTLQAVRGVGPVIIDTICGWEDRFDLGREEERIEQAGAEFIPARDPRYPAALREIHDPPIGLYQKGGYRWSRPAVAIVGSRRTALHGQAVAKRFAGELARTGYCIVSGLARGIDTAAHEGALEAGGATVGVLGNGIDIIYPPENLELYRRVEAGGAIVSEFPFGRRADRQSFAMRNRIISGLCAAVVIVESDVSGGAMITAKFAGEQGRTVFAVPGRIDQPSSAGCHQLIRDGAMLCTSTDDILQELNALPGFRLAADGTTVPTAKPKPELTEVEAKVYACFAGGALLTIDDLAEHTALPYSELAPALMMLELKKLAARRLDGSYEARG